MSTPAEATSSRLRTAIFAPLSDEGRAQMVVSRLVRAIAVGALVDGERLPSESELATLFGVAVVTVREALGELRDRGLIVTLRGRSGGSYVHSSHGAVEESSARALMHMPRVTLTDLGVLYAVISSACAEYACRRATETELHVVHEVLLHARDLPPGQWRRRITDVQLELAALSQSVNLTSEHVRVQTEFTPLLALQDVDAAQRAMTHDALIAQVEAISTRDADKARLIVSDSIKASVRWLSLFQAELLALPEGSSLQALLEARRRGTEADAAVLHTKGANA